MKTLFLTLILASLAFAGIAGTKEDSTICELKNEIKELNIEIKKLENDYNEKIIVLKNEILEVKKSIFSESQLLIIAAILLVILGVSLGSIFVWAKNKIKTTLEELLHTKRSVIISLIEEKELLLKYFKKKKLLILSKHESSEETIKQIFRLNTDLKKFKLTTYCTITEFDGDFSKYNLVVLNNFESDFDGCEKYINENKDKMFVYFSSKHSQLATNDNKNWCGTNFKATLFETIIKQLKLT